MAARRPATKPATPPALLPTAKQKAGQGQRQKAHAKGLTLHRFGVKGIPMAVRKDLLALQDKGLGRLYEDGTFKPFLVETMKQQMS